MEEDMENTLIELGTKLKILREQSSFTQKNIAVFLNVDQSLISKMENGERSIPVEVLEQLASLYGVTLSFFEEDEKTVHPTTIALRSDEIDEKVFKTISIVNKIALNCSFITSLLKEYQHNE